ncbi:MAG: M61 family peptidase [Planctomycetota bacterium]
MTKFLAACLVLLLSASAFAQDAAVRYRVILDKPQTQLVTIEMEAPAGDGATLDFHMPVWRPGRYGFVDASGTIRSITFEDGRGRELAWTKPRRSTWRVETGDARAVRVRYELFADSLNDRTRHVDETHAFLSGSAVFLYTDTLRGESLEVEIDRPRGWKVATGLEPHGRKRDTWVAPDYDILVDSPIEVGLHEVISFVVDGARHEIVLWGDLPDDLREDRFRADFRAIVEEQARVFGGLPYERYVFLTHVGEGFGGGTEHWNSTIMQTRPSIFTDDDRWESFLGLVSHELFHTWNVKRLRPAGIAPYDYQNENMTSLLWVAEGTTSYYDDLTLARAGLVSVDDYLRSLSRSIDGYRRNPGRFVQPLAMSSLDAWTKFTRRSNDTANTTVSFYRKGALVSLMMDVRLLEATGNAVTMDDLMRRLYETKPLERGGFRPEDMIDAARSMAGLDLTGFFRDYVDGVEELDLESAFALVGIELALDDPDAEDEADLGLRLRGGTVSSVVNPGPSANAGMLPGDELVAVEGVRFGSGVLDAFEPGDGVTVTFFRRGRLLEREIELRGVSPARWRLSLVDEPTDSQRAAFEAWMRLPWPGDEPRTASAGE